MPLFNLIQHPFINYALLLTAIWFIWNSTKLIKQNEESIVVISGFRTINTFMLLIVFQLSIDKLL